jgi:TPR repeat protein
VARRWTQFRREVTAGLAVLMLAIGFVLGTYREPITQAVIDVAQAIGLSGRPANADTAYAAYQSGNHATALRLARPLAEAGDARAESLLGLIYYRGRGVPKDYGEAVKWFHRAADQGDTAAQFYLGTMFAEGEGVPKDAVEATKWYQRAADRGDPQAQFNLGLAYSNGDGAQPDNVSAYMWFDLAAAYFPGSDTRRNAAVTSRDLLAKKMTQDEVTEAQKRARDWRPK